MSKLAFPGAENGYGAISVLCRNRKSSAQERVFDLPDSLAGGPSIHRGGALVPGDDAALRIPHDDGVVRQIEQLGLLLQHACLLPERVERSLQSMTRLFFLGVQPSILDRDTRVGGE